MVKKAKNAIFLQKDTKSSKKGPFMLNVYPFWNFLMIPLFSKLKPEHIHEFIVLWWLHLITNFNSLFTGG